MTAQIELSPWDRYSIAGMSGTGKTLFATVLCAVLSAQFNDHQRLLWVQTKNDPKDMARLRLWGYRQIEVRQVGRVLDPRQFVFLKEKPGELPVNEQVQRIARWGLKRRSVFLLLDEWAHGVYSTVSAGPDLKDLHKTGRGLRAGVGGLTQELAFVPRQLFSQANHKVLFRLDYGPDIKIARELYPKFDPDKMDRYGFWHRWSEGFGPAGQWRYYRDAQDWLDRLNLNRLLHPEGVAELAGQPGGPVGHPVGHPGG